MKYTDYLKTTGLILTAISLPFSVTLKTIGIVMAALVLVIELIRKQERINNETISYGFMLLFISSLISTAFAQNTVRSFNGSMDVLKYVLVFFAASSISNEDRIKKILWAAYISTVLAAIWGIYHALSINKQLEIHSLGNWNYTSMFLNIMLASMLSTLLFSDKKGLSGRVALSTGIVIILVASVMTLSRASMIGLIVYVAILILSRRRIGKSMLIFAGIFIASVFVYKTMWSKLFSMQSMLTRIDIWGHAFEYFINNPIAGIGLNNFVHTLPVDFPVDPGDTVYDAHSLYFQIASEMGTAGIIALGLVIAGFIKIWVNLRPSDSFGKALRFGAMGAFLIITVTGLLDTTLHHEHAIAFTMMAGLMLGYHRGQKTDQQKSRWRTFKRWHTRYSFQQP